MQKPRKSFVTPFVLNDVQRSEIRSKSNHDWEQPLEEAMGMIRCLTKPGDLIADLTCGSGTSGVAVAQISGGRRYTACEIDKGTCRIARKRINEALAGLRSQEETG